MVLPIPLLLLTNLAALLFWVFVLDTLWMTRQSVGRDGLHLAATVSLSLGHGLAGLPGPYALITGLGTSLLVYASHALVVVRAKRLYAAVTALGAGLIASSVVIFEPLATGRALTDLLDLLFEARR